MRATQCLEIRWFVLIGTYKSACGKVSRVRHMVLADHGNPSPSVRCGLPTIREFGPIQSIQTRFS
jgi:hypothetical protein